MRVMTRLLSILDYCMRMLRCCNQKKNSTKNLLNPFKDDTIIGGRNMDDYLFKMAIFNRARLIKNSKNRIPYGVELIQQFQRESWIVFTENKKQAMLSMTLLIKKDFDLLFIIRTWITKSVLKI